MLIYSPEDRITPHDALSHPYLLSLLTLVMLFRSFSTTPSYIRFIQHGPASDRYRAVPEPYALTLSSSHASLLTFLVRQEEGDLLLGTPRLLEKRQPSIPQ